MIETERNDAGQFTAAEPDTTGLYGRDADLVQHGYVPMPDPRKQETSEISTDDAAAMMASAEPDDGEPIEVVYYSPQGELVPANEAITLDQAAADFENWTNSNADSAARSISADLAAEVEILRALDVPVVEGDDVGKDAVEKDAVAESRKAVVEQVAKEVAWDGQGLDPEVERALQRPQVRQAIESELTRATAVQQEYSKGLETANAFARASFLQNFPELANLPVEHLQQGLVNLAQTNPARFQAAAQTLTRVNQVQQEQAAQQQRQQAVATQQFNEWAKQSDDAFEKLPGVNHDAAHRAAIGREMVSYFSDLGVTQAQLMHEYKTNPMMRSVAGQRALYDLMESRLSAKKAGDWKTKTAPKTIPQVQRPGVSGQRQSSPHAELESQFAKNPTLKNAQRLYVARSKG